MLRTNEPRRIGVLARDESFRAVGQMESTRFRKFLLEVALITQGACYNDVADRRGMDIDVEKTPMLLLASNFVETMNGQRGFNFELPQEPVSLVCDDPDHIVWQLVEENALRQHSFTYRPFGGLWMSCRYSLDKDVWLLDIRVMKPESKLNLAKAHRHLTAREQVYRRFCEAITPGTYSTLGEAMCEVAILPQPFARIYKELVEPGVVLIPEATLRST